VLDEVRLAVGEAATRAVGRHQVACPAEPVLVRLIDSPVSFVAEVVDSAAEPGGDAAPAAAAGTAGTAGSTGTAGTAGTDSAAPPLPLGDTIHLGDAIEEELPPGIDLAVISGLVDDVTVQNGPSGSVVRMAWPVTEASARTPSGFGASNPSA
jgi:hypothetical protein